MQSLKKKEFDNLICSLRMQIEQLTIKFQTLNFEDKYKFAQLQKKRRNLELAAKRLPQKLAFLKNASDFEVKSAAEIKYSAG